MSGGTAISRVEMKFISYTSVPFMSIELEFASKIFYMNRNNPIERANAIDVITVLHNEALESITV
jgi:hypothetical protein